MWRPLISLVVVLASVQADCIAQEDGSTRNVQTSLDAARALESSLVSTIAKAEKSVVAIARGRRGMARDLKDPQFVPYEFSTGVVVGKDGLILTNYHTLGDVAANEFVVWVNGKSYARVVVKAADPWTDLAVLETDARDLTPIEFGHTAGLKKGRIVIALGNPHAIARDGNVNATWGIISNIDRKIDGPLRGAEGPDTVNHRDRETRYHFGGLIQTDAKLARGTSGGPLLDLNGKMVGLATSVAMLAGFDKGVGYAIPVDDYFRQVVEKLKRGEEVEQGFLGVAPRNPVPDDGEVGVVLERVQPGTPAGQSGLTAFDEIVKIDGIPISNIDELFFRVGSLPPNHVAKVLVRRFRREFTLPVRLTKKPSTASRPTLVTATPPAWRGVSVDFATALSAVKLSSIDPEGCVIATRVEQDSPAWAAGLRVGSVISLVEGRRVKDPRAFHEAVQAEPGAVRLTLFNSRSPLPRESIVVEPDSEN